MPKCAWILTISLLAILHHAVGLAAVVAFALGAVVWVFATPAALVAIAAVAAWHLLNAHTPLTRRRTAHA